MVIFSEWHRTAMDQKSRRGLPMTGEDTGLEVLASPLAGYLGKVQERAASLEFCPWCISKGLTYALRSYRINLQESITLCTNPQCLFPLVSRPLEDVLASLDPVEPTTGNKRKITSALEEEESIKPASKRLRSSELNSVGPQCITDTLVSQTEPDTDDVVSDVQHPAPETDGEEVNGYHTDSPVAETTGWDLPQHEDCVLDQELENVDCTEGFAPLECSDSAIPLQSSDRDEPLLSPQCGALDISEVKDDFRQVRSPPKVLNKCCSLDSSQSLSKNKDIHSPEVDTPSPKHDEQTARRGQKTCQDMQDITSDFSCTMITESEELVPVSSQLFWRNSNNLCWLDSLLVALVNCKSLKECKPEVEPQQSSVWQLIKGYEDVCAAIQAHQQSGTDGVVRVPNDVLQKADTGLQSLRMSVFKLLQPKLHCKLGQRETPVFALPLLLTMDSWVEPLFQTTFHWEFKCNECKAASTERVVKTLPTFTKISPEWRPLHAVHSAPCNVCCKKNQRRTMTLESVPPVFVLHFVEGLPHSDIGIYTFTFNRKRYSVTTVIQYDQQLQHFVTWICNSDGSWLEYDDLKHPECKSHKKLPVPAEQIHVVFWEMEEDKEPPACSPSTTFAESPPPTNEMKQTPSDLTDLADDNRSTLMSHNDTAIICALSASEESSNVMDTTVTAGVDTSIGSTTLLDTFEGLTHNDIITLTLVELKVDPDTQPVNNNNNGQTQGLSVLSRNEVTDPTPDSSSVRIGSETSHDPDVESLATSFNSSESDDSSSSDPTFVPGARGGQGRGRGKTGNRQGGKKAASLKAAPPASPECSKAVEGEPASAQEDTPHVETTQQTSPVSSTDTSPLSTSQTTPTVKQAPLQNSRWSFLLSKHPLHRLDKPAGPITVKQLKPTPPAHSTPNPVRRQQISGEVLLKPQLKTEESDGLPPKAAEMYDAFGAKSLNTPTPSPPFPALLNAKITQPVTYNQKSLTNATMVPITTLTAPGAKGLHEITSSKKRRSQSSKLPQGLSDTESLRHKLLKKLKAKKKKLALLNEMLGQQGGGGASLQPDSTDLGSPNTVTSSTYDGSICDDFLSDLLSPATTASNLSPDSTGFLEMLASGQDGGEQLDCAAGVVSQVNTCANEPFNENFLEDFISQAVAQRPTEMETEALSELFV